MGHGSSAAAPGAERFYSTSTTARIQGWIQHWNLCTPGESSVIWMRNITAINVALLRRMDFVK